MLNRLRIGTRLVLLIAVQTSVMVLIGLTAIFGLNFATNTTAELNRNVIEQVKLNQLNESISGDLLGVVNRVYRGTQPWDEAAIDLMAAEAVFENNWDEYLEDRSPAKVAEIKKTLGPQVEMVKQAFQDISQLIEFHDREGFANFVLND